MFLERIGLFFHKWPFLGYFLTEGRWVAICQNIYPCEEIQVCRGYISLLRTPKPPAGGYILPTNWIVFHPNIFGMNILPQFRYYHTLEIMMFLETKKGFWCIKITNQIISLLKGYTNLVKEHSFLHLRLHVRPFMNILPHQIRICEYLSNRNPLLIWKNIAPWERIYVDTGKSKVVSSK